ncbi:NAD(P)-binding domain-containing protein, partial [Candidatus Binatus sp.]|uniref:NAD(P)-binding domain-containing protein n=1 Tax=Candidatus Binatus sp. TaxID=2811406 RepID=UPI003BAEFE08
MEIGWIGTGIMGAPMARRLIGGGHRVRVYNRSPEKARALAADGATAAADAAACVAGTDVVFIMVPDTPDVEATVARIEPALKAGQLVVDMST